MVDAKKIGVAGAAIVLVTLVAVFATSYMADFETARNIPPNTEDEFQTVELKDAPVLGSETAPVIIVEVGDYQCHMCKLWFEETRPQIIENYVTTGKANLVFIDMPFLGSHSGPASEATYCADDQGKYWEYHTMLFKFQQEIDDGWANASRLQAFALNLGLDMELFDKCMITDDHRAQVNFNMQIAKKEFGANSTPTFMIINTSTCEAEKIVGAHPYSTLVSVIDPML